MEPDIDHMIKQIVAKRNELLEGFAAAYLASKNLSVEETKALIPQLELVERRHKEHVSWHFQLRKERHERLDTEGAGKIDPADPMPRSELQK